MCREMRGAGGFNEWQIKASERIVVRFQRESELQIKTNFESVNFVMLFDIMSSVVSFFFSLRLLISSHIRSLSKPDAALLSYWLETTVAT